MTVGTRVGVRLSVERVSWNMTDVYTFANTVALFCQCGILSTAVAFLPVCLAMGRVPDGGKALRLGAGG